MMQPGEMAYPAETEWKQLLKLSEQLVGLPDVLAQSVLVQESTALLLKGEARLWLSRPFYPLPGEADMDLLPGASAPDAVHRAYLTSTPAFVRINGRIGGAELADPVIAAAVPLIANDSRLGVLELRRAPDQPLLPEDIALLVGIAQASAMAFEMSRQEKLKNWRYDQLALVRTVSAQIASVLHLEELYSRVTDLIQQTFRYYYVAIYTRENHPAAASTLWFRAAAHNEDSQPLKPGFQVPLGDGLIGLAGQDGEQIIALDVLIDPRYHFYETLPETLSEACFPLKVEGEILGVLDIQSDQLDDFHEVDLLVLSSLADSIALAVKNAHLYSNLNDRISEISSVIEVSHALNSILDYEQLLDEIVLLIQKRFGYPHVHIFSVHPGRRLVIYQAGSGERSHAMRDKMISYPLDAPLGLISHVARTGKTFIANDVSVEPLYIPSEMPPHNTRAELAVPLLLGSEVIGVLDIQSAEANVFQVSDSSLFEALASTIAIAFRNASLYRSEKWRRQVAESFRDVAYQITGGSDIDSLLDTILARLETNLPCDAAALWLVDEDHPPELHTSPLRLAAVCGVDAAALRQEMKNNPRIFDPLGALLLTSEPYIRDPQDPPGPLGTALHYASDYSSIIAPLRASENLLGLLILVHHTSGRYGSEAQSMTATFASYAAAAIQNTRLYTEAQQQAWVSTMLVQVAEASQTTITLDDLLATMLRLTRLLVGVRKCAFLLREENAGRYELKAWYGFDPPKGHSQWLAEALPALIRLNAARSPIFLTNAELEIGMPELALAGQPGTMMVLPLLMRSELIGAYLITLQTERSPETEATFDPRTSAILQGIAHQTSITVENLRLLDARQEEAYVTAALLQVAQAVVSAGEIREVLGNIIHLLPILTGVDTSAVYLWDITAKIFRPGAAYSENHRREQFLLKKSYSSGEHRLLDAILRTGAIHLSPVRDLDASPEFWTALDCRPLNSLVESATLPDGSWLLGFPLTVQDRLLGVLVTRKPDTNPVFWERRMEILTGIAQQTSMAIQNDIAKHEMVQTERMEREIQLARQIQETFFPERLPEAEGWELDVRWETARQVGGDFYDAFALANGRIGLVIADVSDKGMPAALYMTVTRTLIRSRIHEYDQPAGVLIDVNRQLFSESPEAMFITAIYAILDPRTGELLYANAGHNLPLIHRFEQDALEQLPKGGTALGVLPEVELQNHALTIQPGDTLVLFTDGACDTLAPSGEDFGEGRLRQVLALNSGNSAASLLEHLDIALSEFRQDMPPFDDVTFIAVRRLPIG